MTSILVGIPAFDRSIRLKSAESIGNAIEYAKSEGLLDRVVHKYALGYQVARARNFMAQWALDAGVDYLWMVDSDIIVPEKGLAGLISHDLEVCLGWYIRGNSDCYQTNMVKPGSDNSNCYNGQMLVIEPSVGKEALLPVKYGGMGCALISTEVFMRFPRPWFEYHDHADGSGFSEDYDFCRKCANNGIKIWLDARVQCGHIHDRVLEV